MIKNILIIIAAILLLGLGIAFADEDFNAMNPTVKVISYKKLFTDQIIGTGSGSGTLISKDGIIVTNHHVIFDDNEQEALDTFGICITFSVQKEPVCKYTARLVADNKEMDVAILKMNEKDVFGKTIPNLKYLSYKTGGVPKEGDEVQVVGYPGSGGETVTITKGQVSGFDIQNNYKYFKTDTDIDHGNSGGTALDTNGNYIGIPTYIRSYAENVGYFLDIREAENWIDENKNTSPIKNKIAENRLTLEMSRLEKANEEKKFNYTQYPELSVEAPTGWKFIEITDDGLYMEQEKLTEAVFVNLSLNTYQFKIDEGYLDKLDEELAKYKEYYPDYKKEKTTFQGHDAFEITYTYYNQKQHSIYIPYGYSLIGITYSISLDEKEKQTTAIQEALEKIKINAKEKDDPGLKSTLKFKEPEFSVTMPEDWRIRKNESNQPMDLLAEGVQKENYDGSLYLYYRLIPKDERQLSAKDRADETIKSLGSESKLIYRKDDVDMDGLPGWLFSYEYEGDDYQEIRKRLSLVMHDTRGEGKYEFIFYYDDLTDNFDENLKDILSILNSFEFLGKGTHDFGSLTRQFSDIQYHRFASSITELADKKIISGYDDGTFRPEQKVTRAEALKIILESKNHLEEERGLGKEIDFDTFTMKKGNLKDVSIEDWFNKYVEYALEKEIVSGYSNNTFAPQNSVNLTEALKMIIGVYEIPIWQGRTDPWYKVYMDKAYELGLLAGGMDDPALQLTRAELCYLVNKVYNQAK